MHLTSFKVIAIVALSLAFVAGSAWADCSEGNGSACYKVCGLRYNTQTTRDGCLNSFCVVKLCDSDGGGCVCVGTYQFNVDYCINDGPIACPGGF